MNRWTRTLAVVALGAALVAMAGCSKPVEPKLEPKIAPPALSQAGVFKAGVDMSTPPFAGKDGSAAGIDVDVASAVAERLGLKVELVDVKPSEAASALADGSVDAVLSVPMTGADLSQLSVAGAYITDVPALWIASDTTASIEPSLTLDSMPAEPTAVQTSSEAYWVLESEFGTATISEFDSLRDALDALDRGDVGLAAGDALVGAYIARDFPRVRYAGRLAAPYPLGIAVAVDNTALSDAVRGALDDLAADGVLDNVRRKWVGELPKLAIPEDSSDEQAP